MYRDRHYTETDKKQAVRQATDKKQAGRQETQTGVQRQYTETDKKQVVRQETDKQTSNRQTDKGHGQMHRDKQDTETDGQETGRQGDKQDRPAAKQTSKRYDQTENQGIHTAVYTVLINFCTRSPESSGFFSSSFFLPI